jgi:hypothetical protein
VAELVALSLTVVAPGPAQGLSTALLTWSSLSPATSPAARDLAAQVYDPATGLVLFGGVDSTNTYNDTWTWSGSTWSQTDDTGDVGCTGFCTASPAVRVGPAMAFDPATGQLVLFGGVNGGTTYNDTWDWDIDLLNSDAATITWTAGGQTGSDSSRGTAASLEVANESASGFHLVVAINALRLGRPHPGQPDGERLGRLGQRQHRPGAGLRGDLREPERQHRDLPGHRAGERQFGNEPVHGQRRYRHR